MTKTYYAVCNVNGPISVRLDGETREQALAAFAALDTRAAIDSVSTDAEDDLEIDGTDMTEDEFAAALEEAGAERVEDLSPIVNAHAGTVAHLADGWMLWSYDDESSDFEPNAVITIHRANGEIERIPVQCEVCDGKIAGPCYTRDEWDSCSEADWEYDEERGLLWQGQPGGPYNFAEYEIHLLGTRVVKINSVTPVHDNPESPAPTSYVVRATVEIDGVQYETTWSALEHDGRLSNLGWESSDQWVDVRLASHFDHALLVELGEEVLAAANRSNS